ncbi:UDP-glucoronosyl/UDP-glucosyl transferase [Tamaricihabitans halophyticus]|uniref:UDP-glucoronosyl/UDP-glucosyl transferase n=2 Tax=Tamaricihabitans halophyticus TaxID=1262583 RepID=A0A4R2R1V0_9PSEU|nr:UDP-glucoronosyl/UDP-glucosyl transferase [Tamaricihabitans halophyticus]
MFPAVHRAGLPTAKIGISPKEAFDRAKAAKLRPELPEADQMPEIAATVFGEIVPRVMFATSKSVIERFRADLVISEIGNHGSLLAAQYLGVPVHSCTWGRVAATPMIEEVSERIANLAQDLGVSGIAPHIDICPPSVQSTNFKANYEIQPMQPVGWSFPDDELPPLVARRERPIIYVTFSSVFEHVEAQTLRDIAQGLAKLPVDVLMATGAVSADIPDLPNNVYLAEWVPQSLVVPHTELLVHHGGPGAMLNAMAAGLPQLVLPDADGVEPGTSIAVEESGTGYILPQEEISAEAIYTNVVSLLEDSTVRSAVTSVAAEIAAMPTPDQVLELLEKQR